MNPRTLNRLVLACFILILQACNTGEDSARSAQQIKILQAPPFKVYTDSIKNFPAQSNLYLTRAALLSQNNYHELATPDFEKTWKLTGQESIALEYAANLLLTNKIPEAIDLLHTCTAKFPENTEFSRRLGEVYLELGEPKKALAQYELMLQHDSSNFEAWFDRASLLTRLKDTSGAIASLERSFALMPINYSGLALANLYAGRKDPRALEVCDILMALDSGAAQTEPLFMKGVYYTEVKQFDQALKEFDECIRRDWKMTDAYIEKGIILYERKNWKEALKIFNMAATVSNTDADAYYWMGRCYEANGDTQQALVNYQRAFALDQSFSEARIALRRLNG